MNKRKIIFAFIFFLLFIVVCVCLSTTHSFATDFIDGNISVQDGVVYLGPPPHLGNRWGGGSFANSVAVFLEQYKAVITFISGIATATFVLIFIVHFIKLGATATNPRARSETLKGMLISGITAAFMGSLTLFVGVFYGMLR